MSLWLLQLCLVIRFLTPAGYMPASLADGAHLTLCPGGSVIATLLLAANSEPHQHHHADHDPDATTPADLWEICPVGVLFGAIGLASDPSMAVLSLSTPFADSELPAAIPSQLLSAPRARGPPPVGLLTT